MATSEFTIGSDSENEKELPAKKPARTSRFQEGEASFEMHPTTSVDYLGSFHTVSNGRENTPFPGTGGYPLPSAPPPRTYTSTTKDSNPFSKYYQHPSLSTTMRTDTGQEKFHTIGLAQKDLPKRPVGRRFWGVSKGYVIAFAVNLVVLLVLIVLVAIFMHAWLRCRRDNKVRILH